MYTVLGHVVLGVRQRVVLPKVRVLLRHEVVQEMLRFVIVVMKCGNQAKRFWLAKIIDDGKPSQRLKVRVQ